jgi:hypothetical protein
MALLQEISNMRSFFGGFTTKKVTAAMSSPSFMMVVM